MKLKLILSFLLLLTAHVFAETPNTSTIETNDLPTLGSETGDKPWSLKMGISTLDNPKTPYQITEGKGVSLAIQREILNKFELGTTFTNYTIKFKEPIDINSEAPGAKGNFNIFDIFVEFTAINVDFYKGLTFKGAVNAGGSYDTNFEDSPFFYGIGMVFEFNRQIGVRADLKTYLSRANTNVVSLVGYF